MAAAIGFGRTATHDLTHAGFAVAPADGSRRWWRTATTIALAMAVGGGAGYLGRDRPLPAAVVVERATAPPAPAPEVVALRQQLDQATLSVRLATARSQELERQIDALHQKLTEADDELAFFRKAREAKKR